MNLFKKFLLVLIILPFISACFGHEEGRYQGPRQLPTQLPAGAQPTVEEPAVEEPAAPSGESSAGLARPGYSVLTRDWRLYVEPSGEAITPPPPPSSEPWKYDSEYDDMGNGIAVNNITQEIIVVGNTYVESQYGGIILIFDKNSGVLKKVITDIPARDIDVCRDRRFLNTVVADDGSFYVAGQLYEGIRCADFKPTGVLLYKYNKTHDNVFKKAYFELTSDQPPVEASDFAIDNRGGFIYIVGSVKVGTTPYKDILNAFIARYNLSGDPTGMFEKFPVEITSNGYAVALDKNGRFAYLGGKFSATGSVIPSAFLLKCALTGERCVQRKIDKIGVEERDPTGLLHDREEAVFGITVSPDGKIYITGVNDKEGRSLDILVIKYNENMDREWVLNNLGTNSGDYGNKVAVDSSGNIYVSGCMNSVPVVIKFDGGSRTHSTKFIDPAGTGCAFAITVDNEDNIYVVVSEAMGPSRGILVKKYKPSDF